jgi:hypothetical protein
VEHSRANATVIAAYGPAAEAYAARLGDIDAVICEPEVLGLAYIEAAHRRARGETFYGLVLVDDPRIAFAYRHTEAILSQVADYDARVRVVEQFATGELKINGQLANTLWSLDRRSEHVFVEFLALCDALLVRSYREHARIDGWFSRAPILRPLRPVQRILAQATVTLVERVRPERPGVVIWGPRHPALETALHLHGLAEFHGELTCVTAGGPQPSFSTAAFLGAGDPCAASALSRAAAVVCIDASDPSDAVAFARLGYGVVAPSSSGANEFAGDIVLWDPLVAQRLFAAVAVAVARPADVRIAHARPPRAPERGRRPAFAAAAPSPLVSIITPTYNRRADLREMLACLAAQTYPNIESVVVNDGGIAVDDIVAEFPFARLIESGVNAGALRAVQAGWEHARGEYIGLLPDDDRLMPEHVERLINAMLRSGAKIAHGAGLLRYLERLDDGSWITTGFNATTFSQTLAESDALVSSTIGGHQMLVHRSIYEDVGWYLLDNDVSDNEMHARISKKYAYAFDDHITSEFRDHAGGQGRRSDLAAAMREVYTVFHPVPGRPLVEKSRALTLEHVAKRVPGASPFPPTLVIGR